MKNNRQQQQQQQQKTYPQGNSVISNIADDAIKLSTREVRKKTYILLITSKWD